MKLLFLDDSLQRDRNYLGYGGFCIDEPTLVKLIADLLSLKQDFNIPEEVELKWSLGKEHFLRTKLRGKRQEVYRACVKLLQQYGILVVCAVHSLNDCYGKQLYNWNMKQIILWATKSQLKFVAERFERPGLSASDDRGLMISDRYGDRKAESTLLEDISSALKSGTQYRKFSRICMPPLMTDSRYCSPLQLADIVVGIIVSALAENRYGVELFGDVAIPFLKNSHEGSTTFVSTISSSVLGYGLVLFPASFRPKGYELFRELDCKYIYTAEGIKERASGF